MNRNTVYKLFTKLFPTYSVLVNGHPYRRMYAKSEWEFNYIIINETIFIQEWKEIFFCTDELVIRGGYGDLKLNIKYRMIDQLCVGGGNDDENMEVTQAKDETW